MEVYDAGEFCGRFPPRSLLLTLLFISPVDPLVVTAKGQRVLRFSAATGALVSETVLASEELAAAADVDGIAEQLEACASRD